MTTFAEALQIATEIHAGQQDKAGGPYIEFMKHVASKLKEAGEPEEVQVVALLQDTITDSTGKTKDDLLNLGVSPEIVDLIVLLTHHKNQPYIDEYSCKLMAEGIPAEEATYEAREKEFLLFIDTLKANPIAVKVKAALLSLLMEEKYILRNERRELKTKFRLHKYQSAIEALKN
ncbi:MAG: hypothetical protein UHC59_01245 [Fibrobacteraceae bacterium]|nr:hypothetical protein [Fibrobacteraceae bacterium]MEE1275598.1 hypothetical protein [Fibrobacteraceae bacterium]